MQLLSTSEAAARLEVDPSRVRLWCKQGRIRALMVGGTYVIDEAELDRFAAIPRPPGRPRGAALASGGPAHGHTDFASRAASAGR